MVADLEHALWGESSWVGMERAIATLKWAGKAAGNPTRWHDIVQTALTDLLWSYAETAYEWERNWGCLCECERWEQEQGWEREKAVMMILQ